MKKWRIYGLLSSRKYMGTVEAETEEEAIENGGKDLNSYVSICHQCTIEEELEIGEVYKIQAEEVEEK